MSLLTRLFSRGASVQAGQTERRSSSWDWLAGAAIPSSAGPPVSPAVVEGLAAAFSAVQIISETIGTLPLVVYRKSADGVREVDQAHPVAKLFGLAPNPLQTPAEFKTMMQANCLLHGVAYAEIIRNQAGQPVELWPIRPGMVAIERLPGTRRIRYLVTEETGGSRRLLPSEVLAIRDRWDDPFSPVSRLQRAREALGGALATERFSAAVWRNGAALSGLVQHPETLGPEAARTLRESLQSLYGGTENAGRVGVLEEGATWHSVSATPHDAELSEARRLAVLEVARIFNVPAPLLNELTDASYSNVVELRRQFAAGTIQPWLTRWEEAARLALFSEEGRRNHELEYDTDLLVRADILTRLQAYRIGREVGLYSAQELRRFENLNPRTDPDADAFLSPLNMAREQTGAPREGE